MLPAFKTKFLSHWVLAFALISPQAQAQYYELTCTAASSDIVLTMDWSAGGDIPTVDWDGTVVVTQFKNNASTSLGVLHIPNATNPTENLRYSSPDQAAGISLNWDSTSYINAGINAGDGNEFTENADVTLHMNTSNGPLLLNGVWMNCDNSIRPL